MRLLMHSIILLPVFLLASCAPSTAAGVRALGESRQFTFTAPENYQAVYRKVLEQSRKCWQGGLITAQMVVDGDLYTDTKSGTVTVALHGGLGVDVYQVIDVSLVSENESEIKAYYPRGRVARYGEILKQWVLSDLKECNLV